MFSTALPIGPDSTLMCSRDTRTCLLVVGTEPIGKLTEKDLPALRTTAALGLASATDRWFIAFKDALSLRRGAEEADEGCQPALEILKGRALTASAAGAKWPSTSVPS
jgi:hypothetical protein